VLNTVSHKRVFPQFLEANAVVNTLIGHDLLKAQLNSLWIFHWSETEVISTFPLGMPLRPKPCKNMNNHLHKLTVTLEVVFTSESRRHYTNPHGTKSQEQIHDELCKFSSDQSCAQYCYQVLERYALSALRVQKGARNACKGCVHAAIYSYNCYCFNSAVGIATGFELDSRGSNPGWGNVFFFPQVHTDSRHTIRRVSKTLCPGVNRTEREADHSNLVSRSRIV
jgi:hypothetical protein